MHMDVTFIKHCDLMIQEVKKQPAVLLLTSSISNKKINNKFEVRLLFLLKEFY